MSAEKQIAEDLIEILNGPMAKELNDTWVSEYGFKVAVTPKYVSVTRDMGTVSTQQEDVHDILSFAFGGDAKFRFGPQHWGHVKARTGGRQAIMIEDALSMMDGHAAKVSAISAWLPSYRRWMSVFGNEDVKADLVDIYGESGYRSIMDRFEARVTSTSTKASTSLIYCHAKRCINIPWTKAWSCC